MINLLPPALKEELRYARYNRVMVHYVKVVVIITLILAGSLLAARYYLARQISASQASFSSKQAQISSYHGLEAKAGALNAQLASIQAIQKTQPRFSVLLSDLANYMPAGSAISSITLTGSDKQPVRLSVTAVDYKTALSFRDSIARSKRISAADIENIQAGSSSGPYNVSVVFAFTPGGSR